MKLAKKCPYCGKESKHKGTCKIVQETKQKEQTIMDNEIRKQEAIAKEQEAIAKQKEKEMQKEMNEINEFFEWYDDDNDDNNNDNDGLFEYNYINPPSCRGNDERVVS
jgi:DNA repair exonuclease SbcCD ATPase subunit